jgi:hypothetical protein
MFKRKRLRLLIRHFHKNGLKFVLENSGNIYDLLQMLDFQLLPWIDLTNMRVVPGRFIGRGRRGTLRIFPTRSHAPRGNLLPVV